MESGIGAEQVAKFNIFALVFIDKPNLNLYKHATSNHVGIVRLAHGLLQKESNRTRRKHLAT